MKYHSCRQSQNTVKKLSMKNKLILALTAILSIFGTVSCKNRENLPEMSVSPRREILIHGEKVEITTVLIDGKEYIANNQGGSRWTFSAK